MRKDNGTFYGWYLPLSLFINLSFCSSITLIYKVTGNDRIIVKNVRYSIFRLSNIGTFVTERPMDVDVELNAVQIYLKRIILWFPSYLFRTWESIWLLTCTCHGFCRQIYWIIAQLGKVYGQCSNKMLINKRAMWTKPVHNMEIHIDTYSGNKRYGGLA